MKTKPFTKYDSRFTRRGVVPPHVSRFTFHATRTTHDATGNTQHVLSSLAFTLIEIMITVALLSLIVLGLLAMFNQTQRAFRTSMTQSDVLEAGRSTMELLSRELTQMTPTQAPDQIVNNGWYRATNFFVEPNPFFTPLWQALPGMPSAVYRTNSIQRLFFISRFNQDWLGTGYEVLPEDPNGIVGSLYRFYRTNTPRVGLISLSGNFLGVSRTALSLIGQPVTNMSRIADGVVHFRVRAYAKNGFLIVTNAFRGTNAFTTDPNARPPLLGYTNAWNTIACASPALRDQSAAYFMSNALPAYVDVELGILEPQILQRYRSIPVATARLQYLSNHVAQVHIFHQRIAIPNLDTTAYP
ncbi:MAG TPA: hypothetical protein VL361_17560 [Candidatus Limnocylindrales bacterium]|nr:hypothetical protein [Candidatus Limnocylindrales bacterium]